MSQTIEQLYHRIEELTPNRINLMEVCGTHTVAISRLGIRSRLPHKLRLLSGPGCPVCVSPAGYIDSLIEIALQPGTTLTTFGDLLRVPGSVRSLKQAVASGAKVKVLYSPLEALEFARQNSGVEVVFAAVGFETTLPTIAATIIQAEQSGIVNLSFLMAGRLAVPAMSALLQTNDVRIDGFICPGHVSVVTGSDAFKTIVERFAVPCAITGFEAVDILSSIISLLEMKNNSEASVVNNYLRAVKPGGNLIARQLMEQVFDVVDSEWRGIGVIPASGVKLKAAYSRFDAEAKFGISIEKQLSHPVGCSCGEVMRGLLLPDECPLFGNACEPSSPVGPCMVSTEGACAAYYNYGQSGRI